MRQALLVIVLVGAAFGGGALVSGPGFRWAQEHLLDYMGLQDGGEIDALDLAPTADAAKPSPSEPLVGTAAVAAAKPAEPPPPTPTPAPAPEPTPTEPFAETQASGTPPPASAPAPDPAKPEPPALLGALTSILSPQSPAPGSAPAGSTRPAPESPTPAPLDAGVAPAALAAPEAAQIPAPAPTAGTGGDWGEVRRKLTAAGVTRYTIEGEPGGRVVFACLIPVAGKQAVSQRFEAEGADEFQAAQAVLKRINLWRASHPASSESP
ncbi:hypothetical protein [Planctomyces sp. SH-PL62]|uniref:hypothetical protein n=1 Tax=Planctomyces sp. SH-PL62 TaxID=1636152 RepID=UPI00078BCC7C|nr:hypothetical protein [Planctomyces sp. SH-PL62]AMV40809.1 hypothetical protein VT85_25475 [Planctomyces sp. SH-PL62]